MKAKRSAAGIFCLLIVIAAAVTAFIISDKDDPGKDLAQLPSASASSGTQETAAGDKITYVMAETAKNQNLEDAIIREIGFPGDEDMISTRYYYNMVDLNDDGTDEVFVELVGPYTSGSGGDTGLIFRQDNGQYVLLQRLTLIRNPIIISNSITNGWHDIGMTTSNGGSAPQLILMKFDGNKYPNPSDAEAAAAETDLYGTAIITDNIAADFLAGRGLYLTAK